MSHAFSCRTLAAVAVAACAATPVFANNGLGVNGAHYNLNILGKTNCGISSTGSNGHVIQVLLNSNDGNQNGTLATTLDKRNKIFLSPGPFSVTDPNACDSQGAAFSLPAGGYTVWARALGKPGGKATLSLCAVDTMGTTDTTDDTLVCNTGENVLAMTRKGGQPVFTNVTKELTTLTYAGTAYNLFDPTFQSYFWDYDNNGMRLLQLRFYASQQ
jgi:hypothetical protein